MAYDPDNHRTVLFGGVDSADQLLGDTWSWDGNDWSPLADSGPAPRSYARMIFDDARHVFVLFGGRTSNGSIITSDETWELGPAGWVLRTPEGGSPPARYAQMMSYDSARQVTVMFGGLTDDGNLVASDTWEWDGSSWTSVSSIGPSARESGAMCYDSERGVSVLFGGQSGMTALGDTWEWTGSVWVQRSTPVAPASRSYHASVFDSLHRVTVLYGGYDPLLVVPFQDTWCWDGQAWSPRNIDGPGPRTGGGLAFDGNRGRAVLFGGNEYPTAPTDSTWELDLPGVCHADFDGSGFVDTDDFDAFVRAFEAGC